MNQTAESIRHMNERYADQCRRSLREEQTTSLAETDGWAHVDKDRVHADWDALYKEIAVSLEGARPEDDRAQELIEKHFEIASRFYSPTREAYIGMAMLNSKTQPCRSSTTLTTPGWWSSWGWQCACSPTGGSAAASWV